MNNQRVREFMSRKPMESDKIKTKRTSNVVAYPQSDAKVLAQIMKDIRIEYLPILSSPWDKKIVGFVELNKLKVVLKD